MLTGRSTLAHFLIEQRRAHDVAEGDLNQLLLNVAIACKGIANRVACGALGDVLGDATTTNVHGETQKKLDLLAHEYFLRANERSGMLSGMVSEEQELPYRIPARFPRGRYLLVFDPLDGSSNIDVNASVGSIFSVLRAPEPGQDAEAEAFLQAGTELVCAGYAVYGPSTMLVLSVGTGVHGFTLDPHLGEFVLTHPAIRIPAAVREFAINASNARFWEPAVKRYVDECLAGQAGPRGADFNMRWIASLVAELHRILLRGGVFLYPRDARQTTKQGRLRLLYECQPVAYLVEQAGGLASTGRDRLLEVVPEELHQRSGFVFGSREEVERIEQYHRDFNRVEYDAPLFGQRGLFRTPA